MDAVTKRVMQVAAMPPVESDTDRESRVRREQSGLLEGTAGSKDAFSRRSSSQAGRVHSVTDTISRMPSSITSTELRAPSWPASSELSAVKHSDTDGGEMTFKRVVSDTLLRVPSTSRPLPPLSGAPSRHARGLAQENVSTEGKAGEQALKCPDERMMMSEGPTGVKQGSRKKERASPSAGMISPDDALWCTQPACVRARTHACMYMRTHACMHAYTHGQCTFTYATDIHAYTFADAPREAVSGILRLSVPVLKQSLLRSGDPACVRKPSPRPCTVTGDARRNIRTRHPHEHTSRRGLAVAQHSMRRRYGPHPPTHTRIHIHTHGDIPFTGEVTKTRPSAGLATEKSAPSNGNLVRL